MRDKTTTTGKATKKTDKAPQPIVGEDGNPITIMHLVAMREIGEAIVAELVTRQTGAIIDGHPVSGDTKPPTGLINLSEPATE